jgi:hypothetical protein
MADMWRSRSPPTPLDFDAIINGTFYSQNNVNDNESNSVNGCGSNPTLVLKDQRALTLKDNLDLFISRYFCCDSHLSVLILHEVPIVLPSGYAMARKPLLSIKMMMTH